MPYTPATASSVGTVQWVRTPDALSQLTRRLRGAAEIALDTESDSLHHFPEKVCLLQVATPDGAAYLVDPLAVPDLAPLGEVCADPGTVKILHRLRPIGARPPRARPLASTSSWNRPIELCWGMP